MLALRRVALALAMTSSLCLAAPAEEAPLSPYPTSTSGPCPIGDARPCTVVLGGPGAPSASPECSAGAAAHLFRFTLPERWADTDRNGFWESVLALPLDPVRSCGCARIRAFFGDRSSAWTLHVGNSPTNNGHGGDEGTTAHAAELHVADTKITVYTAAQFEHRQIERLLDVELPTLANRIVELEICEQTLSVSVKRSRDDSQPLSWHLETASSKLLFSFGSTGRGPTAGESASLYLGLNRVVHALNGAPSHGRVGAGLLRVEIELSP